MKTECKAAPPFTLAPVGPVGRRQRPCRGRCNRQHAVSVGREISLMFGMRKDYTVRQSGSAGEQPDRTEGRAAARLAGGGPARCGFPLFQKRGFLVGVDDASGGQAIGSSGLEHREHDAQQMPGNGDDGFFLRAGFFEQLIVQSAPAGLLIFQSPRG